MTDWKTWLLAFAVLAAAIALTAWFARNSRTMRGLTGLGAMMLGFGQVMDPPQRHRTEAAAQKAEPSADNDEPKDPEV